ncbi:MAG TPA: Rieske 2Fe-2S domain-containing protein [Leptospiraceae bacterium]|nr:Rieske 2Fe-2S domain-containing protein [Leptospiraceae bacterium]HMW05500.1 Rieske 2Fe-2S domain-containing protein [Leptospiraceae bacterium]HMX32473.1 Rieske 2Fe-2S domain-containing protein [Leptospiraceae bacterium]HMY31010.1 Rieske 2Fe-2S domain-containing protein [Leptospiraceae bacterium]HMZ65044.1 Rieske 2Fe-2S domain-containing protein [Leptospiraceae bacterium]
MSALDHWHPVLKSGELKNKPISIILNEKQIVLFRDKKGLVAGLENACPHRRMALSEGFLKNGRITCIYHGMSFDRKGNGISPGTEDCKISAKYFDCIEFYGAIWIKSAESFAPFPYFNIEGFRLIDICRYTIDAPLELVLDNFTEVEHTPDVHLFLGYDPSRMKEVLVETTTEDDFVRIKNTGPQKKLPFIFNSILELNKNDLFVDDWTTYFSPIYSVYDQYWIDPKTNQSRENRFRIYVFFNPISDKKVQLFAFSYMKYSLFGNFGLNLFIKPSIKYIINLEILRDKRMLEKILDKDPHVAGMRLTRFDRSLGPNRKRIEKIYKGNSSLSN